MYDETYNKYTDYIKRQKDINVPSPASVYIKHLLNTLYLTCISDLVVVLANGVGKQRIQKFIVSTANHQWLEIILAPFINFD